jgi:hypothetical protein
MPDVTITKQDANFLMTLDPSVRASLVDAMLRESIRIEHAELKPMAQALARGILANGRAKQPCQWIAHGQSAAVEQPDAGFLSCPPIFQR